MLLIIFLSMLSTTSCYLRYPDSLENSFSVCPNSVCIEHLKEGDIILISSNSATELDKFSLFFTKSWSIIIENRNEKRNLVDQKYLYMLQRPNLFLITFEDFEDLRYTLRVLKQLNRKAAFVIVGLEKQLPNIQTIISDEKISKAIVCTENDTKVELSYDNDDNSMKSTLIAGYIDLPPYIMNIDNSTADTDDDFFVKKGTEVNLINLVAKFLNVKVVYKLSSANEKWGTVDMNGTATGSLKMLSESKVDILLGTYHAHAVRSFCYDASPVYTQDSLKWCVPYKLVPKGFNGFHAILDWKIWLLTAFFYLIITTLIWYTGYKTDDELTSYKGLTNVVYNVLSLFFGISVIGPRTFRVRVFLTILLFFSINATLLYQTFLTSLLTKSDYVQKYGTVERIYENDLKTYFPPSWRKYFEVHPYKRVILDRWIDCPNNSMCQSSITVNKDSTYCFQKSYIQYFYNDYQDHKNDPLIYCFGDIVTFYINIFMRKDFPLYEEVNTMIYRIIAAGLVDKWQKNILRNTRYTDETTGSSVTNQSVFLNIDSLHSVFLAVIVGKSVATLIFFLELIIFRVKVRKCRNI